MLQHQFYKILLICFLAIIGTEMIYAQHNLIPLPVHIQERPGQFTINRQTKIFVEKSLEKDVAFIYETIQKSTGLPLQKTGKITANCIVLSTKTTLANLGDEGYELDINPKQIIVKANHTKGLFNGLQTLLQLMPPVVYSTSLTEKPANYTVPAVYIYDYPRFSWRGMMLDVSRQFFDTNYIKKYIDWLASHKINLFHWHLTDDEGWRIEIKKYPLLTKKGAWRGKNEALPPAYGSGDVRYGGFYTQNEIRDIVAYAQKRNVSILPEIDLPGHSRAVTVSYPQVLCLANDTTASVQGIRRNVWCAGRNENFEMIEDILTEVASLFPFEYIHIGGDEVNKRAWENCERCQHLKHEHGMSDMHQVQSYFVRQVETIVNKLGKKMIGWNEIMEGGQLNSNTTVMAWLSAKHGYQALQLGYEVVMVPGPYLYFDMAQSADEQGHTWAGMVPIERVYSFNPQANDTLSVNCLNKIKGVQAALWSEFLDKPAGIADYQTYPRLCALAELAWTPQNLREWNNFKTRLQTSHYNRLYNMGIAFRLPPPDAVYTDGSITVKNPGTNLIIRYTVDGSEPTHKSEIYTSAIKTTSPKLYRFKTFFENHGSITMPAFPFPAATWSPENTPVKFDLVEFDITPFITSNGDVEVKFRLRDGIHGLQVKKVELLQNGISIDTDVHDGLMAAGRTSNNIYNLKVSNHSPNATYSIKVEMQGRWGINTFGDILVDVKEF